MQKIIFLTCFVLEITRGGNFYAPPPNHLTSIKKPNHNRVNTSESSKALTILVISSKFLLENFTVFVP